MEVLAAMASDELLERFLDTPHCTGLRTNNALKPFLHFPQVHTFALQARIDNHHCDVQMFKKRAPAFSPNGHSFRFTPPDKSMPKMHNQQWCEATKSFKPRSIPLWFQKPLDVPVAAQRGAAKRKLEY